MPIAHCILSPEVERDRVEPAALIEAWARHSGQPSDQMTLNLIFADQQGGAAYPIMAQLYLPSLWSSAGIQSLQLGLATALAEAYAYPLTAVQVITTVIESGLVVENGEIIEWPTS